MKQKTFAAVILTVTALCVIFTLLHVIYAYNAYNHCSIIYFIAKELW